MCVGNAALGVPQQKIYIKAQWNAGGGVPYKGSVPCKLTLGVPERV